MEEQNEETIPAQAVICTFWKRIVALLIDGLILGTLGSILGLLLFNFLMQLGGWGRLFGFGIALLYFGLLNSSIGKGQTVGKRIMKIRVVNAANQPISLGRSCLRYVILGAPFALNGAMIPSSILLSPIGLLVGTFVFGVGGAIIYLYLFNRRTRQSLHDLAVGSFVVNAAATESVEQTIWKPHLIMAGLLILMGLGLSVAGNKLTDKWHFPELLAVQDQLTDLENVYSASVTQGKSWGTRDGEKWENTYLHVVAIVNKKSFQTEETAQELANLVLQNYPKADEFGVISISLSSGFDIGIARVWSNVNFSKPPEIWSETKEEDEVGE